MQTNRVDLTYPQGFRTDPIYIYKVDVDQEEALETAFNIRTIPTLMFCPLDGPREMMIGTMGKLELKQLIQEKLLK
mgnify:CR=1 FL=1